MTRKQTLKLNNELRAKYEEAFYPRVKKVLGKYIKGFTKVLKKEGVEATRMIVSSPVAIDKLPYLISSLYVMAGIEMANVSLALLRKFPMQVKKTSLGFNAEWTNQIIAYFQVHLMNLVVQPIDDTTRAYIQLVLMRGIEEGWSIETMVQEIEREDYLDGRVRRIIRTEVNRAINYGAELAREKFQYQTQKRWVAVNDARTRHDHHAADGQTVASDGFFTVGGETMSFPGDPTASANQTVNCRCFCEDVAVRDAQGRLIPKEDKPPVRIRGRLRRELQEILNELQA